MKCEKHQEVFESKVALKALQLELSSVKVQQQELKDPLVVFLLVMTPAKLRFFICIFMSFLCF